MREWEARVAEAAGRARAAMAAGANLDEVLHTFRTQEQLGTIESMAALREIGAMDLACAKVIVSNWYEGRSYAHLTLADLDLLGDTPRAGGVDFFMRGRRNHAIIERQPYLLCVREREPTESVDTDARAVPLEAQPASPAPETTISIPCDSVTFERLCDDVRKAAAAWPSELRILRDEHDQLLLHFLRAPSTR